MKKNNPGACLYCNENLNKKEMEKHILVCENKKHNVNDDNYFFSVEGEYLPEYWLYLKAASEATLMDLDAFLRKIWLECCGHLSCFKINNARYASTPDDEFIEEKSMNYKISELLKPGDTFLHEYDYGSTTELKLKLLAIQKGNRGKKKVDLISRNLPIINKCSNCKEHARYTCQECSWQEDLYLCEECSAEHECGEEMLMPVTNSPRSGVCGYTG